MQQIQSHDREADLEIQREIEMEFQMASMDKSRISALGQKLEKYGLFEKYQDRFFRLVNR